MASLQEVGRAIPRPGYQLHDGKERKKTCRSGLLAQQRQPDSAETHPHHRTDHEHPNRCPVCPPLPEGVLVEVETEHLHYRLTQQHTPYGPPSWKRGLRPKSRPRQNRTKLGFPTWRAVGLAVRQQPLPAPSRGIQPTSPGSSDEADNRTHMLRAPPTLCKCERSRDRRDKPHAGPSHEARSRTPEDRDK
ncbi:hypothetical protein ATANTOWER_032488 [Ataeniobius toweri]|uniref:Uncharacterized protein n=1 Tax=Ataeniobius toweri TaxID=208326 RepID=A0ABU7BIQ8_9TELE|nr:hypothetical protein [Ataeniobius toweri]